jgi:hypothetical protein
MENPAPKGAGFFVSGRVCHRPGIKPQAPGHRLPARHAKGVPYYSERTSGATG